MELLNHRCAWKSQELLSDNTWQYVLSNEDLVEIDEALNNYKKYQGQSALPNRDNFILNNLSTKLKHIQNYLENDRGIFLLRNFPVEFYSDDDIKTIYLGVFTHLGVPLRQSINGELIYEVIDRGGKLGAARGTATKDSLPFHSDRSDVVALLCLQKAKTGGISKVVSSAAIHNELFKNHNNLLKELYGNYFHARTNWEAEGNSAFYNLPVFSSKDGLFATRYLRYFINEAQKIDAVPKMNALQIEALNKLEEIANNPEFCVNLEFEVGDVQLLNNFTSFHSREGYEDYEDTQKKRKLFRLWLSVPNSRPLIDEFSAIMGNTFAGSMRGGVFFNN